MRKIRSISALFSPIFRKYYRTMTFRAPTMRFGGQIDAFFGMFLAIVFIFTKI